MSRVFSILRAALCVVAASVAAAVPAKAQDSQAQAIALARATFEKVSTGSTHTARTTYCHTINDAGQELDDYYDFRSVAYTARQTRSSADSLNGITASYIVRVTSQFYREGEGSDKTAWAETPAFIIEYPVAKQNAKWRINDGMTRGFCFLPQRHQ